MSRPADCIADLLECATLDALTEAFDRIEIECTRAWNGPEERELAREARQRMGEVITAIKARCWPLADRMSARLAANDPDDFDPPPAVSGAVPQSSTMEIAA